MSTLVPTSAGSGGDHALLLRQPVGERLPAEARRSGGSPGKPESRAFLLDRVPGLSAPRAPVVVLAVNLIAGPGGRLTLPAQAVPSFASFESGIVGDPYATASVENRGTLVDAYV